LRENVRGKPICYYCYESYEYGRPYEAPSAKSINKQLNVLEQRIINYLCQERTIYNMVNDERQKEIEQLQAKLKAKDEIIAELMECVRNYEAYEIDGELARKTLARVKENNQ
jgi:hypothetical protein